MIKFPEEFKKKYGIENLGDNNTPPTPYRPCDISEFWTDFATYGLSNIGFQQFHSKDHFNGGWQNVHYVWYSEKMFMIAVDRIRKEGQYIDVPRCYRVGCIHKWIDEILNSRSGDCKKTCLICGLVSHYNCGD